MNEINAIELKKQYMDWLDEEIKINKINNYLEITSPFLDRYNDYLQVYVKIINENQIYLTDDGYIINNLKMSGIDFKSNKRQEIIDIFLKKYGVKRHKDELVVNTSYSEFSRKLILLMQAMLNIDDMFMLSQSKVASLFNDDVKKFFYKNHIYYSENVNFFGKSGLCYSYDYLIQRTKDKPERLCKTINEPNIQNLKNNVFMWNDTKETRNPDSKFIVLLNDSTPVNSSVIDGFKNYDIQTILWSKRNEGLELLTA